MTKDQLIHTFSQFRPNAMFVSIKEYSNKHGEIANHSIAFHIDYLSVLKKSQQIVLKTKTFGTIKERAKEEILLSLRERIDVYTKTPLEKQDDPYFHFQDTKGKFIKGIKQHKENGSLYMFGLLLNKQVLIPGDYKEVNSSELTIEKRNLLSITPVSKFRQYFLFPKQFKEIKIENMVLK